jgi:Flp pilus assembly protein TadG
MPPEPLVRAHGRARLASFVADERAAMAVEFAIVAPFTIALVLITLMTSIIYLARSQLDAATQVGARAAMLGTATSRAQLTSAICGAVGGLLDCSKLMVNLNTYSTLSTINTAKPTLTYDASGAVTNAWSANFGSTGSIMVLQVMYEFPMFGTSLFNLSTQANGTDLLVSTAVFINE